MHTYECKRIINNNDNTFPWSIMISTINGWQLQLIDSCNINENVPMNPVQRSRSTLNVIDSAHACSITRARNTFIMSDVLFWESELFAILSYYNNSISLSQRAYLVILVQDIYLFFYTQHLVPITIYKCTAVYTHVLNKYLLHSIIIITWK